VLKSLGLGVEGWRVGAGRWVGQGSRETAARRSSGYEIHPARGHPHKKKGSLTGHLCPIGHTNSVLSPFWHTGLMPSLFEVTTLVLCPCGLTTLVPSLLFFFFFINLQPLKT